MIKGELRKSLFWFIVSEGVDSGSEEAESSDITSSTSNVSKKKERVNWKLGEAIYSQRPPLVTYWDVSF